MRSTIARPMASWRFHPNMCSACAFQSMISPLSSIPMTPLMAVSMISLVRPSFLRKARSAWRRSAASRARETREATACAELLFFKHPGARVRRMFMAQHAHEFSLKADRDVQHGTDSDGDEVGVGELGRAGSVSGIGGINDACEIPAPESNWGSVRLHFHAGGMSSR